MTTKGLTLTCADVVGIGSEQAGLDLRSVSKCAMKQAERARIAQALRESHGNRAKAAKNLKISRAGLYNKLREYGLT